MKLYTVYSPSYVDLYTNYFLSSLPSDVTLEAKELPQDSPSGECWSEGYDITEHKKIKYFKEACESNQGNIIICCDADIQFFGDIVETVTAELGDYDLACQDDGFYPADADRLPLCVGFMVVRCNQNTINLFTKMDENFTTDSQLMLIKYKEECQYKLLSNKFFTAGQSLGWRGWNYCDCSGGEKTFTIPNPILMHHANYTFGFDNKKKLLDIVKERVEAR